VVGLKNRASETGSIAFDERLVKETPARLNLRKAHLFIKMLNVFLVQDVGCGPTLNNFFTFQPYGLK
jgi:hypothetical protein